MISVDTSAFEAALKDILLHTSRDVADVINGAAVDIIINAAKTTHTADPAKIERALTTGKVVQTHTKSGKKLLKHPKLIAYKPALLVYLIINARQRKLRGPGYGLNNAAMHQAAQALIQKRKSGAGYTAFAGWQKALIAFGGHGFGTKMASPHASFERTEAARGYGIKATPSSHFAMMVNTAPAAELYAREPMERAIAAKTAQFVKRVEDKLAGRIKAVSK